MRHFHPPAKQEFSKGDLIGLKRLVHFSAKVPGVCNSKIGTLLKAINEEYQGNGISRSTFKRMTIKAKELGILTIHETERKNGSQSSNLYSFNRFPQNEPPKAKKMNQPKETINLLKTNQQKNTKRTKRGLKSIQITAIRFDCHHDKDDILTISIPAFKQLLKSNSN
jgi:translation initiation factor IF-3